MLYCSTCGSDQLVYKIPEGDNFKRHICNSCGAIHYINPRVIVGCLPVYNSKIVICKRAIEPCKGKWNLPAGFMENNERAEDGALRELKEESGLEGNIIRLHCIYSIPHVNQVYLIFLTEVKNDEAFPGEESLEVGFFNESEIPWEEIGFTSSTYAIEKYLKFKDQSNQITHVGSLILEGKENRPDFL